MTLAERSLQTICSSFKVHDQSACHVTFAQDTVTSQVFPFQLSSGCCSTLAVSYMMVPVFCTTSLGVCSKHYGGQILQGTLCVHVWS